MNRSFVLLLVAMFGFGASASVLAQSWPAKPLRLVIGFPPGASADVAARLVAAKMSESLGQAVLIENKPGAGSNIATEFVVRAAADCYTLLLGSIANTINASLSQNLPFDFGRDLAPITSLASMPNLLVVAPSLGVSRVHELVAAAKLRPGEILYGSSGNGTSPHLSGELFNLMAGVKLTHVPYKGSPQAMTDLLGGRVQVMFAPASTALPHIKAGTLKVLAVSSARCTESAPELSTIAESGLAGFETSVWFGLLAPAGTPKEIIERLNREANRALADATVKTQFAAQGIDAMGGTPEQFTAYIKDETAKWARVVQASGAKID